ncbi:MAG: 5'-nucleotidase, lipoprotein e(P4) family [Flavobacteriaceae bacterium]|nr:5'-nucleotidase, lipoprotein e(P4) family [Flavobacteriaceae bacterium]
MKKLILLFLLVVVFAGCTTEHSRKDHSIFWQKNSAEYHALCIQAYNIAKTKLDKAIAEQSNQPLAIVADIDETILNNLPYNQMLIDSSQSFNQKTWSEWVNKQIATPIPGALDFFNYASKQDVEIIYLSNRSVENYAPTKANLISAGFPFEQETIMLLRGDDGNKESRRNQLSDYNIVLLLGDNLADFDERFYKKSNQTRIEDVNSLAHLFGDKFIVFPNLIYGTWEMGFED